MSSSRFTDSWDGDDFDGKPVVFDRLLKKIETLLTSQRSGDPTAPA